MACLNDTLAMERDFAERMDRHGKVLVGGPPPYVNSRRTIEKPFIRYTFMILTIILLSIILIFNVRYISQTQNVIYNPPVEVTTIGPASGHVHRSRSFRMYNKEYHFFTDVEVNWAQALQFCLAHGFDLADIPAQEHDEAIKSFILKARFAMPFWVGGLGIGNDNDGFFWIRNGRMLRESYSAWGNSQPDNLSTELCLEINYNSGWNNRNCNGKKYADQNIGILCQKEID